MTNTEVLAELTGIFRSAMADETIVLTPTTILNDIPNWDSFHFVEIILQVEETIGARIRAAEATRLRTIGEMAELIRAKQAA